MFVGDEWKLSLYLIKYWVTKVWKLIETQNYINFTHSI